jgi:hypothetical protein
MQEYLDCAGMTGRLTELLFYEEIPIHWLPLLQVTRPPRKSPWLISRLIRQAAYHQLRTQGLLQCNDIIEMIRRGERVVEDTVPIEDVEINLAGADREAMAHELFSCAIEILLQSVSTEEKKILPIFAGMYVRLRQPTTPSGSGVLTPTIQYITLQYQSIIYSLIIYLQARDPRSTETPEFSALWDLTAFKSAMETTQSPLWTNIISQMDPTLQIQWRSTCSSSTKKPSPRWPLPQDKNNPFMVLSSIPLQED